MNLVSEDNLIVGNSYYIQIVGELLRRLQNFSRKNGKFATGKFYGICKGLYPDSDQLHTWELKCFNGGLGIGRRFFLRNESYVFPREDVLFYESNTGNIHLRSFQRKVLQDITRDPHFHRMPVNFDYTGVRGMYLEIPLTNLIVGTEYFINVNRGEREFTQKKNSGKISGSVIGIFDGFILYNGMLVKDIGLVPDGMLKKLRFCDIKEVRQFITEKNAEIARNWTKLSDEARENTRNWIEMLKNSVPQENTHPTANLFEPVSSGLTKKFIHSEGVCLELGPGDFIVKDITSDEYLGELGDHCSDDESDYDSDNEKCGCSMMGGRSKRRRKSRKTRRKSKRRKKVNL
jgi:hypothetical protein